MPLFLRNFLLLLSIASGLSAQSVTIAGSDLLADVLTQEKMEGIAQGYGLSLDMQLEGSLPALTLLEEGKADMALIAIPDGMDKPEGDYIVQPFGYLVAHVVVHEDNRIAEISLDQLAGIYGSTASVLITRWNEISPALVITTRAITPVIEEDPMHAVHNLFAYTAMRNSNVKASVANIADRDELEDAIESNRTAIGILMYDPDNSSVKSIPVSKGGNTSLSFGPTQENVFLGDYPLRLPIYIVIPREAMERDSVKDVRTLLQSNDVADLLKENNLMPVPEKNRK